MSLQHRTHGELSRLRDSDQLAVLLDKPVYPIRDKLLIGQRVSRGKLSLNASNGFPDLPPLDDREGKEEAGSAFFPFRGIISPHTPLTKRRAMETVSPTYLATTLEKQKLFGTLCPLLGKNVRILSPYFTGMKKSQIHQGERENPARFPQVLFLL
jgi:hypothetical protein